MKLRIPTNWLHQLQHRNLLRRWKQAQLSLLDLFAFMTAIAVLLAILTPVVKLLITGRYSVAFIMGVVQVAVLAWATAQGITERRRVTKNAGERIGVVFYGTLAWRWWPRVKSCLILVLFLLFQVAMFAALMVHIQLLAIFVNLVQLSFFFARYAVRFYHGVYPSAVEVFEHGIVSYQVFFPWSQVELRPSQYFPGQHALVVRSPNGMSGGTYMVRLEEHEAALEAAMERAPLRA